MPLIPLRLPQGGRARERARRRLPSVPFVKLVIVTLNMLFHRPGRNFVCTQRPSAAQLPLHGVLLTQSSRLLSEVPTICGDAEIHTNLPYSQVYGETLPIRPLGLKSGVPDVAANVDLAKPFLHISRRQQGR